MDKQQEKEATAEASAKNDHTFEDQPEKETLRNAIVNMKNTLKTRKKEYQKIEEIKALIRERRINKKYKERLRNVSTKIKQCIRDKTIKETREETANNGRVQRNQEHFKYQTCEKEHNVTRTTRSSHPENAWPILSRNATINCTPRKSKTRNNVSKTRRG